MPKYEKSDAEVGRIYNHSPKLKPREEVHPKDYKRMVDSVCHNDNEETDLFGKRRKCTKERLHEYMKIRMPNLGSMRISRSIFERIDLSPEAKLVYGIIGAFRRPPRLYMAEIAGLVGLSLWKTSKAVHELEAYGLLRIRKNYYSHNRRAPSTYIRRPYADRFKEEEKLIMHFRYKNNNLEERIREQFYL